MDNKCPKCKFKVGDRVIIRDDLALNKKDLPDLIGRIGIVRNIPTSHTAAGVIMEVVFEKHGTRMRLFPRRFRLVTPRVPDWEV